MAYIENSNKVSGNANVYGDALVYGDAVVSGNANVSGNAFVSGEANISSNDDWFSLIYSGKTLTGYRSRNADGYELNIDGLAVTIGDVADDLTPNQLNAIDKWSKPTKSEIDIRIEALKTELAALEQAIKDR